MARIDAYKKDNSIQDRDAWVGTDAVTRKTRQYTAGAIADYLNLKGKVSINGQFAFSFTNTSYDIQGAFALPTGNGNGTPFSSVTDLAIARTDTSGGNTVAMFEYLTNKQILIAQQDDPNAFGHFALENYTQDATNPQFYNMSLSYIGGNGNLVLDKTYAISMFEFAKDKGYEHVQNTAATVWNVNHGLDKYPAVSVVNTNNIVVMGEIEHINKNNLTITFAAAFAGKAYLN